MVLPEMFTTGFSLDALQPAEAQDGSSLAWMRRVAADKNITLVGSVRIQTSQGLVNRCLAVTASGEVTHYDKRHLFRMAGEHQHYRAGNDRVIVKVGDFRVLLLVCYDLRFPVWCRNRNDYDLAIVVANWPAARRHAWRSLLVARAIENHCYCIGVNRIGEDANGIAYEGDSMVVNFKGELLCDLASDDTDAAVSLSLAELHAFRERFPVHLDADRFTLHPD